MATARKYRVIISGTVLPEKPRAEVIAELAALFHARSDTAEKLLQGKPVALVKEYARAPAEKICDAIRTAGAECKIEEIVPEPTHKRPPKTAKKPVRSSAAQPQPDEPLSDTDTARKKSTTSQHTASQQTAFRDFIQVNADYYCRQFAKFSPTDSADTAPPPPPPKGAGIRSALAEFAVSWHWPAFFVFFLWAAYRKLWYWAGVNMLGSFVFLLLIEPGLPIYLTWTFFWPLTANYLYFRHVRSCLWRQQTQPPHRQSTHSDQSTRAAKPDDIITPLSSSYGGVSRLAVLIGIAVTIMASFALNDIFTERVLQNYSERLNEVLATGSLQHGDGSVIDNTAGMDSATIVTVTELELLAMSMKWKADKSAGEDPQQILSVFQEHITEKSIQDSWGTEFIVKWELGQFILVSAGPDAIFGNADDILRYIDPAN